MFTFWYLGASTDSWYKIIIQYSYVDSVFNTSNYIEFDTFLTDIFAVKFKFVPSYYFESNGIVPNTLWIF